MPTFPETGSRPSRRGLRARGPRLGILGLGRLRLGPRLAGDFATRIFHAWEEPEADAVVVIKHAPPLDWVEHVVRRAALIFAPVDFYSGDRRDRRRRLVASPLRPRAGPLR